MNQNAPQTPDASSGTPSAPPPASKAKPRSPVERVIVYGMIGVLLVLVGIQAHARFGYTMTLNNLRPRIDDEAPDTEALPISEIPSYIVGWPTRTEGEVSGTVKSIEYRWNGLLGKSYGLMITYNTLSEPYTVQGLASDGAPEPDLVADGDAPDEAAPGDEAPAPAADDGGETAPADGEAN